MEISVIERIKRLPQQTEESLRDAFSVLMSVEDRKSVCPMMKGSIASASEWVLTGCWIPSGRLLSKIKTPNGYRCADLSLIYDANEISADDCLEYIYGYPTGSF